MGYRSDVALTIKNEEFNVLTAKAKIENQDAYDLIKYAEIRQNKNYTTLSWECVKWYESYDDVSYIEQFMNSGIAYSFKRVGEDYDDVETSSNFVTDNDYDIVNCSCYMRGINVDEAGEEIELA